MYYYVHAKFLCKRFQKDSPQSNSTYVHNIIHPCTAPDSYTKFHRHIIRTPTQRITNFYCFIPFQSCPGPYIRACIGPFRTIYIYMYVQHNAHLYYKNRVRWISMACGKNGCVRLHYIPLYVYIYTFWKSAGRTHVNR